MNYCFFGAYLKLLPELNIVTAAAAACRLLIVYRDVKQGIVVLS